MLEHLDSAGRQGGRRVGRLRHADRPAQHGDGARGRSAPRSSPTRATSSPSRRSRCRASPCFIDDGIEPRHVDLRPYVLYGDRVTDRARRPDARGAAQGLAGRQLVAGRRQQGHLGAGGVADMLLSRVADALYWISRYLERAEHTARADRRPARPRPRPRAGGATAGTSTGCYDGARRRRRRAASPRARAR